MKFENRISNNKISINKEIETIIFYGQNEYMFNTNTWVMNVLFTSHINFLEAETSIVLSHKIDHVTIFFLNYKNSHRKK